MKNKKSGPNLNKESSSSELFAVAFAQAGLFTAKQASECGYALKNHYYHVKRGHWTRQIRGHLSVELNSNEC